MNFFQSSFKKEAILEHFKLIECVLKNDKNDSKIIYYHYVNTHNLYPLYFNRQTGKTTNLIVKTLYHFYSGKNVVLLCRDQREANRVRSQIRYFRLILDPIYSNKTIVNYQIFSVKDKSAMLGYRFDIELRDEC